MTAEVAFAPPYFEGREASRLAAVLESGWVAQGPEVLAFEREFAERVGAVAAVATSSGTAALQLALHAAGIGPGDEVVVPALSFIATANAVRACGAEPVFADVELDTQNLDPASAEGAISPSTRAIMPVHQLGLPADLEALAKLASAHDLVLVEDAAAALGAELGGAAVGSFEGPACFSLHARKIITTGEGGMIAVSDEGLAERLRRLRHQGVSVSDFARHESEDVVFETYEETGFNFRLSDLQAALGRAQLELLDDMLEARRRLAGRYTELLSGARHATLPSEPPDRRHNFQSYAVVIDPDGPIARDDLIRSLAEEGISTRRGVMSIVEQAPYRDSVRTPLPNAEHLARWSLLLPMHPALQEDDQDRVVEALRRRLD